MLYVIYLTAGRFISGLTRVLFMAISAYQSYKKKENNVTLQRSFAAQMGSCCHTQKKVKGQLKKS